MILYRDEIYRIDVDLHVDRIHKLVRICDHSEYAWFIEPVLLIPSQWKVLFTTSWRATLRLNKPVAFADGNSDTGLQANHAD